MTQLKPKKYIAPNYMYTAAFAWKYKSHLQLPLTFEGWARPCCWVCSLTAAFFIKPVNKNP